MIESIFRIVPMRYEDHLWIFQLELCNDNDLDVKPIFDQMKIDYSDNGHTNKATLAIVLSNMGKYDQTEEYLRRSFDEIHFTRHRNQTDSRNEHFPVLWQIVIFYFFQFRFIMQVFMTQILAMWPILIFL